MSVSLTSRIGAALALLSLAAAVTPRAGAQPAEAPASTEVAPDGKVTFRIAAPRAGAVTVAGDWVPQGLGSGGPLEKDDRGVWSLTVGPLPADFYSYSFNVDGARVADPRNPLLKPGLAGPESLIEVPGEGAEFEASRDVPHGEVRAVWYRSATLDAPRRMHVYTPPGYEAGAERYPVLYLLHGAGDEDSGWSTIGRAGFILDNLIAAKKAVPMIVVMPNGSLPRPASLPRSAPGAAPTPELRAAREAMQNRFTDELLKEVVPFVESHYRARPGRAGRALAGLSMGGGQTLRVVTTHPDQFAYVGVWSAGIGRDAADFEERNKDFLDHADRVNAAVRLLSIRVGDRDTGALAGSKALAEILDKRGIKHELGISGGGHTWINWRHYLSEFAPKLFH